MRQLHLRQNMSTATSAFEGSTTLTSEEGSDSPGSEKRVPKAGEFTCVNGRDREILAFLPIHSLRN